MIRGLDRQIPDENTLELVGIFDVETSLGAVLDDAFATGELDGNTSTRNAVRKTTGHQPIRVEPNTAVSGATIQGGILAGDVPDFVLIETTKLSVGVVLDGSLFYPLLEQHQTYPAETSERFVVSEAMDTRLVVFQGSEPIAACNTYLGTVSIPFADDLAGGS